MAPTTVDDDEKSYDYSESRGEESSVDGYESDYGNSDCSVTSAIDGHLQEAIVPYPDLPAADITISQTDESGDTTWTDDKHSSYLDSIEATFVQKMYGKEYCSLDLCGHSCHSSVSLDQACVESPPFCLNMRKPHEQEIAGVLPFKAPTRPWLLAPSVLASPWIQHFKAKQVVPVKNLEVKNLEAQEKATKAQISHLPGSTEESLKSTHATTVNAISLQSHESVPKRRGVIFNLPDCKQSATNSRGYYMTSHGNAAGGFKKLKCQQALSHMDMLMEEQYNSEQQSNIRAEIDIENVEEELKMHQTSHSEPSEAMKSSDKVVAVEISLVKEKQASLMGVEMGSPTTMLSKVLSPKKLDQVVPSFKDVGGEASGGRSMVPMMPTKQALLEHDSYGQTGESSAHVDGEEDLSTDPMEPEVVSAQSGSKTWTWGIQGPRYQLSGKMPRTRFKFSM